MENQWIAACGLDCEACEIRRLPFDTDAAAVCVAWYREMGWLTEADGVAEAIARKMTCCGCRGDRGLHWSVSDEEICWILECCVDQRGQEFCSQCAEFPCERLAKWSQQNGGYRRALERLRRMNRGDA
ncbi:DUF3795 domain-containing protein [Candidatus Bipolaricaulota bacterium]|nr:DUF3795 domain-containing protein [Candidatus Bipolaricaulota bacterium]